MAKEWILNSAMNRFQLNFKRNVGPTSESIRQCAPKTLDEWDRLFNVDFFIKIKDRYIGIQIKPINQGIQLSQIFKEKGLQVKSHERFTEKYGGKVFYVFSSKVGERKEIRNQEVIAEIEQEIERLKLFL